MALKELRQWIELEKEFEGLWLISNFIPMHSKTNHDSILPVPCRSLENESESHQSLYHVTVI